MSESWRPAQQGRQHVKYVITMILKIWERGGKQVNQFKKCFYVTYTSIPILPVRPLLQPVQNCYHQWSLQTYTQNPANIHLQGEKCNICRDWS